jgi:hypothetical protein
MAATKHSLVALPTPHKATAQFLTQPSLKLPLTFQRVLVKKSKLVLLLAMPSTVEHLLLLDNQISLSKTSTSHFK